MSLRQDELAVWAALATLLERLPPALDAQLQRDSSLTHFEYGVLFALDNAPDHTLRLSTLAAYASCTLSRLSRAMTRLERDELVERSVDPADGRFTLGRLTQAGHERVAQATPGHRELVQHTVFDALTDRQAQQLGAAARRIAEGLGGAVWSPTDAGS
jgi:DNA-binding MarR family transcriptional regulator